MAEPGEPLEWTAAARLTATRSVAGRRPSGRTRPGQTDCKKSSCPHADACPLPAKVNLMLTVALPRISSMVFIASCLLFGQPQSTTAGSPPQTNAPAQPQPTNPNARTPTHEAVQQPTTKPQVSAAGPQPKVPQTPKEVAWQILDTACTGDKTSGRATAIRVLGLMPNDAKALKLAEKALDDDKPEVRSAAAAALGDMKSRTSIPKLREALDDKDPSVALAAAHSLDLMHDHSAYEVYYEVLTGQRKAGRGLIASQTSILKDPKKMAHLGFEEGIGFVPFAGVGWVAVKTITKDDTSPVRAAAAKVLAKDPDPAATKTLADAVGDKNWLVRAAALEALAKRGDPAVLDKVSLCMSDKKEVVKYTAAAAVLRLTAIKEAGAEVKKKGLAKKSK